MEIHTIGFAQKTAEQFFGALKQAGIRRLIDIRLNNTSQLARFTRRDDLPYFLSELCGIEYVHELLLAPTREILDAYKKEKGGWEDYERDFKALLRKRKVEQAVSPELFSTRSVLLCSESEPEHCHRRLVAEYLREKWRDVVIHHR